MKKVKTRRRVDAFREIIRYSEGQQWLGIYKDGFCNLTYRARSGTPTNEEDRVYIETVEKRHY